MSDAQESSNVAQSVDRGSKDKPQKSKKQRSDAEKIAIVRRFVASGQSHEDFCQLPDTPTPKTLKEWVAKFPPVCPECQKKDQEIALLKQQVEILERFAPQLAKV